MSEGHADNISGSVGETPPVDPALWERPDLRSVLGTRDITGLYQALTKAGLSQHRIAKLTGQNQSEVCEILKGRQVIAYDVHKRIAEGSVSRPDGWGWPTMLATSPVTTLDSRPARSRTSRSRTSRRRPQRR